MIRRHHDEAGAATVFGLALLALLLLVTLGCGVAVAALAGHRRSEAAADLAALGGAQALQSGGDPCGAAGRVARLNGAGLDACAVRGEDVVVTVHVALDGLGRLIGTAGLTLPARARAGPGDGSPPGAIG